MLSSHVKVELAATTRETTADDQLPHRGRAEDTEGGDQEDAQLPCGGRAELHAAELPPVIGRASLHQRDNQAAELPLRMG